MLDRVAGVAPWALIAERLFEAPLQTPLWFSNRKLLPVSLLVVASQDTELEVTSVRGTEIRATAFVRGPLAEGHLVVSRDNEYASIPFQHGSFGITSMTCTGDCVRGSALTVEGLTRVDYPVRVGLGGGTDELACTPLYSHFKADVSDPNWYYFSGYTGSVYRYFQPYTDTTYYSDDQYNYSIGDDFGDGAVSHVVCQMPVEGAAYVRVESSSASEVEIRSISGEPVVLSYNCEACTTEGGMLVIDGTALLGSSTPVITVGVSSWRILRNQNISMRSLHSSSYPPSSAFKSKCRLLCCVRDLCAQQEVM